MWTALVGTAAPFLFRLIENRFGSKTGKTKMETVMASLRPILDALATAGRLGGPAPTDDAMRPILEALLGIEKGKPDWVEGGIPEGAKILRVVVLGEEKA